jgi:hypothetical protein
MEYTNSKGVKYYLHKKMVVIGRNKIEVPVHFFRKVRMEGFCALPIGYKIRETPSGLPVVKKL